MKSFFKNTNIRSGIITSLALLFSACENNSEYNSAEEKQLIEAVYASGHIEAFGEHEIFAQTSGILAEILMQEGQEVRAGQSIFKLNNISHESRYKNALAAYELANQHTKIGSPKLKEAKNNIAKTKEKLEADSVQHIRYKNLWEQNATSASQYDASKLTYQQSSLAHEQAKLAFQQLTDQLNFEAKQAFQNLQLAMEDRSYTEIKSNVSGIFFESYKDEGEFVRAGEAIGRISKSNRFYASLKVDEMDVLRLKNGQKVFLKIDAYPNKIYEASLSKIYAKVNTRDQSLKAEAWLKDELPANFSGLALEANIIIQEKVNTLVIPSNWIYEGDSLKIQTDQGEKMVKIEIGMTTLNEVEILSGIDKNAKILKP